MEKSTVKFLSVLLSLAIILSFPVISFADDSDSEDTPTGTYESTTDVRNVLISGAYISEWYQDKVTANGNTYSVWQNQYGINEYGNMIDVELGKAYTLYIYEYSAASLRFEAPESGTYTVSASQTENSAAPSYEQVNIFSQNYTFRAMQYGLKSSDETGSLVNYSASIVMQAGEVVYLSASVAGASGNYDITVVKDATEVTPSTPTTPSTETVVVTPSTPTTDSSATTATPSETTPAESTAEEKKPTKTSKKVDGVWVDSKQKKANIKKVEGKKKSITVSWKKAKKVKGYQVQYSSSKKFKKKSTKNKTVKKAKKNKTTVKKLKSKKTYYVRVRTYKNVKVDGKNVKVYSKWSKVKTVKTK